MKLLKKQTAIILNLFFFLLFAFNASADIITSPPRNMPNHDQKELPSPKSGYYCGPVAAWNSIEWLYDTYPSLFNDTKPADWKAAVNELAGYMKTDVTKGTWVNDFIDGKKEYFKNHGKPNKWTVESRSADWNSSTGKWGKNKPTWAWIKEQMDKKQDVEVIIRWDGGAHWTHPAKGVFDDDPDTAAILTFDHYIWDDTNDNNLFDPSDIMTWYLSDPHQETTSMSMSLGTSPIAPGADWIKGWYGTKQVSITAAVAESPIPEPGTIILMLFGLAVFAGFNGKIKE
ncbi:PEP-CTERM sorting domain-containing protein [Candidatus Desantisbacteria bacterium]|nr:PEP-CTERM sorting domain-containing protein [Candidatus Desantisbacteria bacterium]